MNYTIIPLTEDELEIGIIEKFVSLHQCVIAFIRYPINSSLLQRVTASMCHIVTCLAGSFCDWKRLMPKIGMVAGKIDTIDCDGDKRSP